MTRHLLRRFSPLFALVLLASTAALAQQTKEPAPSETMLTGCLRSSGADTAVAGPSGRLYTLEVVAQAAPMSSATTTTGSGTAAPSAPSKTTYSLAAPEALGLAKHADHRVELTGSLQAPSTAARPEAGKPAGAVESAKPGGAHRTFNVTAVKMLAATCAS